MNETNPDNSPVLLAKGGGDATASGVRFQAALGAVVGAELIAAQPLDPRLGLGAAKPAWIRFETESPIDDILIATDMGGFVAVQAKVSLSVSRNKASEFGKTIGQLVRHYLACRSGDGGREWDRPVDSSRDRFLIAVGTKSPATMRQNLAQALDAQRQPGTGAVRPLSKVQNAAIDSFYTCLRDAWSEVTTTELTREMEIELASLTVVIPFDFDGANWIASSAVLGTALGSAADGEQVLHLLVAICQELMSTRSGVNEQILRQKLQRAGAKLLAPESYRSDVTALEVYSARVQETLARFEEIEAGADEVVSVRRDCQDAVLDAALDGSLLIIGEPGSGKSAVINALGRDLRAQGYDVLELAVDRLPVESLEGLGYELGLKHPLLEVLNHWDSGQSGYLLIDALDATRGGASEVVFRSLISELISGGGRWRVIASIRTFDLRLGQQQRSLFKGEPPQADLADPSFPDVRHIKVPTWTLDEMDALLAGVPAFAGALANAGSKLKQLATVPFNTRLLAELVASGINFEGFSTVDSQVELLRLYWDHRVSALGEAADVQLQQVVKLMVQSRSLRASRIQAAVGGPDALQALFQQGVLSKSADDRYVSFRHHLLFDYAASRVYIDPDRLIAGTMTFSKSDTLGLMLGPALTFVLRELWFLSENHQSFWRAVICLLADDGCDPVIRSVAARVASELPVQRYDAQYLADCVVDNIEGVEKVIVHVVGALAVRLGDEESMPLGAWTEFAARLGKRVDAVAWPLRTLSYLLIERVHDPSERASLGTAARELMRFGLSQDRSTGLVDSAIGFVADTYDSDPDSSRALLRQVFDDERFAKFGPEEAPDLARKVDVLALADPDFVAEVYKEIYSRSVTDDRSIAMGSSQIMPLRSNARQDFGMARYSLGEFFPKFLVSNPEQAVTSLVAAVEGYFAREHASKGVPVELEIIVGDQTVRLIDDLSYIWASDPDDQYRQDADVLIASFVEHLLTAPPEIAINSAECVIRQNRLAVLWSRLFLAAAKRPTVLGDLVWPYASREPYLVSTDTRKDAIDVVAATYSSKTEGDRRAFETDVFHLDFSRFVSPDAAQEEFLQRLFRTIDADHIVTEKAKGYVLAVVGDVDPNERLFGVNVTSGLNEPYGWLKDEGVDLSTPVNSVLRESIDSVKAALGLENVEPSISLGLQTAMGALRALLAAIVTAESSNADSKLCRNAEGILAQGINQTTKIKKLKELDQRGLALELADLTLRSSLSPYPEIEDDTESSFEKSPSWGSPAPRVDAAEAALALCRVDVALYKHLLPGIERLISDPHPAVRLIVAKHLVRLWEVDRPGMWLLAGRVVNEEQNLGVLSHFANSFFGATLHHDPVNVEALTVQLYQRVASDSREEAKRLITNLGGIVGLLWVSHERIGAGEILQQWIIEPVTHEKPLNKMLAALRGGLVLGYENKDDREADIRHRSQALVAQCVEETARRLEILISKTQRSEDETSEAQICAKLLDDSCSQIFFASGAHSSENKKEGGLPEGAPRLAFLDDLEPVLLRIGDVGTPHTIYYLLQLLDFLLDTDPPRVFDISVHALLNGGRLNGYQYESMGSELLVSMVGECLADYREIFDDQNRRQLLIECLETFLAAGWPEARRLLYRLPEMLQ